MQQPHNSLRQVNMGTAWLEPDRGVRLNRGLGSGIPGRGVGSTAQQLRLRDSMLADLRSQNKALAGATDDLLRADVLCVCRKQNIFKQACLKKSHQAVMLMCDVLLLQIRCANSSCLSARMLIAVLPACIVSLFDSCLLHDSHYFMCKLVLLLLLQALQTVCMVIHACQL